MESSPGPPPGPPPMFPISERIALLSRVHIGTTIPLLVLCLVPFIYRMYIRIWPVWRFGVDDGFIVAGLLCAITDWALLVEELYFETQLISFEETLFAVKLAYFAIPVWAIAMTLIKTSIILTLLRLPLKQSYKVMLYILLAVQLGFGIANTIYNFVKCQPYHAAWDMSVIDRRCPSGETDIAVSNFTSALNIATDLVLSVTPMFMFWNLHRPLRERILICSLTSIGLFATFASVMKVVVIAEWNTAGDSWSTAIAIATWTITEQFVSILAACSPSLKKPIETLLNKFGIPLVEHDPNISFMHVPPDMRGSEAARRRARGFLGDEEAQPSPVLSHTATEASRNRDSENWGKKSLCSSATASTSRTALRGT
ncbi:uncharacterized protein B0H64DRAFT_121625 [Chaetomium fimeti]|uniref:Rhodopsin domain-containing protein n=1 Tax=Chaetomium fimeti TaxID=1854472 RepID=A0AAE0LUG0_9PEZI|nr:hypothetical protein B0H64DRAFT_121625 [Chaetomium fimeti]